jgi:hypothetical protein
MLLLLASASEAKAVTPTTVPLAAFSATPFAAALVSLTAPTSNSSTSPTAMLKTWVLKLPSALVARTVMLWLAAASRSSSVPLATVTTPVAPPMAKRPPASLSRV